jgi:hypothetical protein
MKKREFLSLSGALPLMLAGCGSGGGGNAQIRLLNASVGYSSLDLLVNSVSVTGGSVAYGGVSTYTTVADGSQATVVEDTSVSGSPVTLLNTTRTLTKDGLYTIIVYGFPGNPKSVQMVENQTAPATGYANVSILNTSPDVGSVDVYFSPTPDITNVTATARAVTAVSQTTFTGVLPNTYYVVITAAGQKSDVRLVASGVSFVDQQISTLIITPGNGGVLANAIVLTNGSTSQPQILVQTQARLRLIVGVADGSGATVFAGGVQAQTLDSSPGFFQGYALVAAGGPPTVQINGTSIPLALDYNVASANLKAGSDYTVVVYGDTGATAQAKLLADSNTRPLTSTNVKARLVHLVNNRQNQLTLQFNFTSVASNVDYGNDYSSQQIPPPVSSTAYSETAGGSATVTLLQNGATVYQSPTGSTLTSGYIYTAFAFEPVPTVDVPNPAPTAIVLADRSGV